MPSPTATSCKTAPTTSHPAATRARCQEGAAASAAPGGWAGPPPGPQEGVRGAQPAAPPRVRFVFAAAPASTVGGCGTPSPPWKWQLRMLILLPLPFMDSLASPGAAPPGAAGNGVGAPGGASPARDLSPTLMAPLSLFPYLSGLCFLQK